MMMMTGKALGEARWVMVPVGFLAAGALLLGWQWVAIFFAVLFVAIALFFRDPQRDIPADECCIVSPADGTVDLIEECQHIDELYGPGKKVSIFLSVFDVHINRVPYDGVIRAVVHRKGSFLDARLPESSIKNENQIWVIDTKYGAVGVRQIAGLIARRIVGWCEIGQVVKKGDKLGLIRFGSRTEIYLPHQATIEVKAGQKVRGGSTVVARWPEKRS